MSKLDCEWKRCFDMWNFSLILYEEYQRLQDLIEEIDDQEEIEALEANYKSLCEKIDEAKPNQVVITRNGEYYETIERYSMKFYEDSKLRTKGLIAIKD